MEKQANALLETPRCDSDSNTVNFRSLESPAQAPFDRSRKDFSNDSDHRIRRILVPTDFSERSATALEFAKALAQQHDAKIVLLHVVDINTQYPRGATLPAADMMTELWSSGVTAMHELARSLDNQVAVRTIVEEGLPWEQIVSWSRESDLVILANTTKWRRWRFFSRHTMDRVLQKAGCPVMVVNHHN